MLPMLPNIQKSLQSLYAERATTAVLIFFGVALRLRQYIAWRSLWLDEAMLALNIVQRDFGGLLKTLDYNQGGPVGFLLLEKLVITLLGNNELTLRLIPLLAGCAALLLFALLLRQALGKIGTFTALALFAASAPLIYYTSEVKQYSSDVFVALLLLWLATIGADANSPKEFVKIRVNKKVLLIIVGALAIWCSHPAFFVLAGIGATFLLQSLMQKDREQFKSTLVMLAFWAASFVALYFISLRGLVANTFLLAYWQEYFMPLPPWVNWSWFPDTLRAIIEFPIGLALWWPFPAVLMLLGLISLLRRNLHFGLLLSLPLLAALAASALGKYPFIGRLILFSAPFFLALIGAGVDEVCGWLQHPRWLGLVAGLALFSVLLYGPLANASQNFINPKYPEHIRPALAYLRENRKPGDTIYVYYWAVPAFRYYAPFYGFSEDDFVAGKDYENNPLGLLPEVDRFKGQKRTWVLFSHVYEKGDYNEKDALLAHLNEMGVKKREFIKPGTSVSLYLYDLTEK